MNATSAETRSVVVERDIPFPPDKIWRALTQPHLIEEWLMKNDFNPVVGHRFNLRGDWGGVLDCEVLTVEPNRKLSYTWNRMEQVGFRPDQRQAREQSEGCRRNPNSAISN